ncbi:MAG: dual specificity protein phosphatase family protein [Myxococcales bacterium]|nr:dual specificity protein phosphatase family protein [Myxococcales bacterium]MCB9643907.1 dual specificity protein phosphatase family protein [Myxococcales bacterium]
MKIDWLSSTLIRPPARLGLCAIPGRTGSPHATLLDLDALVFQGVTHVIAFVEPKEFAKMNPPESPEDRKQALAQRGIDFFYQPIPDQTAPTLRQTREVLEYIEHALRRDASLVLHCWAGLGRAGTFAASYLISQGYGAEEAIDLIRWTRPFSIQSPEQEQFLRDYAATRI